MIHDIPTFINDKEAFFRPVFARFIIAQCDFYSRAAMLYKDLLPCFQHLDRLAIHQHQPVITDEEHTSSNEPIDLTKPVDKAELQAERSAYRSVATGGAPSSTGYMSQMGHAPPGSNVIGKPLPPPSVVVPPRGSYNNNNNNAPMPPASAQPQPHYPPPNYATNQYGHQQQQPPPQQYQQQQPPYPNQGYPPQSQPGYPQYQQPPQQQPQQPYYPPVNPNPAPLSVAPPPMTAPAGPKKFAKKMPPGPGAPGGGGVAGGGPGPKKGPKKGSKKLPPGPGMVPARPAGTGMLTATALYPFQGQDQTELTFAAGDVISLIRHDAGDWWEGELNGVRGLLPSNYVQLNQ